ncbi:c-type cytochrome [Nevskia sp.]|uniref:c-type cytochrome n=1 Tax=Nevskia sp. TaxID=1929292 RepID=UPI003F725A52
MSKDQDKKFMISFAGVLALLFGITFGIVVLALFMAPKHDTANVAESKKVAARTAPIGTVITDPALLVKTAAVAREPWSGEQVYTQVCSACHDAGVLEAPKPTDKAAWATRKGAAGGVDGLAASAIKGKNAMPARGGKADLSDAEIKAAIELMLQRAGV